MTNQQYKDEIYLATPTKSKIPYIPIAIGLVVVLGVIIYIKKAK